MEAEAETLAAVISLDLLDLRPMTVMDRGVACILDSSLLGPQPVIVMCLLLFKESAAEFFDGSQHSNVQLPSCLAQIALAILLE